MDILLAQCQTCPKRLFSNILLFLSELESSRTSLALRTSSRTQFEVFALTLASNPQVLKNYLVLGSRTARTIFEQLKFRWKTPETLRKICKDLFLVSLSRDRLKKIFEDLFRLKKKFEDLFFGEHLRLCPWSLALASRGSVLGLEPCVLDSTSDFYTD